MINFLDHIGSDLSKMDQNGSNLIKLEFSTIFSTFSTYYKFLIFFITLLALYDKFLGSYWIRPVQNGSNLIKLEFSPIKKCYNKKLS